MVPDQIIDRTQGVRESTFFGGGVVAHVGFADPFDEGIRKVVSRVGKKVCEGRGVKLHTGGTLVCMGE